MTSLLPELFPLSSGSKMKLGGGSLILHGYISMQSLGLLSFHYFRQIERGQSHGIACMNSRKIHMGDQLIFKLEFFFIFYV